MRVFTWLLPAFLLLSCAAQAASDHRPAHATPASVPAPARITDPPALCEAAAAAAEYTARLPPRLLSAISLTETGRLDAATGRLRPWPWSVDIDGAGQFFATREDAIAAVKAAQAQGVKSIDVGCMQVNLMFHPDAFADLEQAFDPTTNARYAARFLNALYAVSHDWSHAIAAYHSETPALGDAYRVVVLARWQNPDLHAQPAAIGPASAYQAFAPRREVYADFQSPSLVYGAFSRNH
jgi:soluble lytic murein transglycosylase-like protein